MDETIRDYIRRCVRLYVGIAALGWVVILLTMVLVHGQATAWLAILGMLVFTGGVLALQLSVRCPKCAVKIGHNIAIPVGIGFGYGPRINFCPYCGVDLDTPRNQPTNPIS